MFGVQYYGECWSGPLGHKSYDIDGPSNKCWEGVGGSGSNYVYAFSRECYIEIMLVFYGWISMVFIMFIVTTSAFNLSNRLPWQPKDKQFHLIVYFASLYFFHFLPFFLSVLPSIHLSIHTSTFTSFLSSIHPSIHRSILPSILFLSPFDSHPILTLNTIYFPFR